MIERRPLRSDHEALAGLELPRVEAVGERGAGPHLALVAGIHGCEYASIAAVTRFMATLDTSRLAGRITAVPIVNVPSFRERSPFVSPADGKNLNRCFPGSLDGSFSDILARVVFDEVIRPADFVLDLHGGDLVEALEPFALYEESPVEEAARGLAVAFGLPYVVRTARAHAPVGGTTAQAAAAAGIPAVIAEAGGRGLLEESDVRLHLDGIENVLRHLRMLPGEPRPPRPDMRSVARFVWLRSRVDGWWQPGVAVGDEVEAGALLGSVLDLYGDLRERVVAPEAGVPLFVTSSPAVAADGLLLGLGAGLAPV